MEGELSTSDLGEIPAVSYLPQHLYLLKTQILVLFSAVSPAFVIDVKSKLEPDSGERSEAYLWVILLSLNQSVSPDKDPVSPPVWSGPPTNTVHCMRRRFILKALSCNCLRPYTNLEGVNKSEKNAGQHGRVRLDVER
jgi:hypothetical protein